MAGGGAGDDPEPRRRPRLSQPAVRGPVEPAASHSPSSSQPMGPLDGREMMLAVTREVPGAFERLVAVYESRIKAAVARSISDRSSVDDLAQEVLLRLYRARARYEPTARFETFLYRIIFNLCVNHTQYQRRRRTLPLEQGTGGDDEYGSLPADVNAPMPFEDVARGERAELVRAAMLKLPENQRRALQLSRFEGLGYEEIAGVMDLSVQAVKSLLWRARENLRESLSAQLGGPGDA
jgi:RNA polymerase sigma-70 factor, ECF subfamily